MDFYQLTYFKKVAETRSISRASEELLLTQPAVSKQIKALEDELGKSSLTGSAKRYISHVQARSFMPLRKKYSALLRKRRQL
jgi:DNA-binding transcriptional LysR family regulator